MMNRKKTRTLSRETLNDIVSDNVVDSLFVC